MSTPDRFVLDADLPAGVTVLEASAGTGKTYTIAALTTRFVAEGVPLERMLAVTFTRMATGELRERIRERLLRSERLLNSVLAGTPAPTSESADPVDVLLAAGSADAVRQHRDRLTTALSSFDSATIATTHSFCHEMLIELGTHGELEPGVQLIEHVDDLRSQVVDDLYVRRFWKQPGTPLLDRAQAGLVAEAADRYQDAVLHPLKEPDGAAPAMRLRLAHAVRQELRARKRALGLITYDDLVSALYKTLTKSPDRDAALKQLRNRYQVVLIDEFQDTDPVQWEIVSRAFGASEVRLVLIADPKQAIYAFRGADVFAYLNAARTASSSATLPTNYRSDGRLLAGFDALFANARLGHREIAYRQVSPAQEHKGSRLQGAPEPAALRFRVLDRTQVAQTGTGAAQSPAARAAVAQDVAADIVALLSSDAQIPRKDTSKDAQPEPLTPGDIAVLVPKHSNASAVREQLEAAGVPVVIAGAGSVMDTPAAQHWLTVLEALERPASALRARTAALTPLLGWSAETLSAAGQTELEGLHRDLHRWARLFSGSGVATMTQTLLADCQVAGRLLAQLDGERLVTDLEHVAELLHRACVEEQFGLSALTGWLRKRIAAARAEGAHGDERTRRLDSDAAAVQVLTIHRSKGLEWPVVYCPYLWDTGRIDSREKKPVYFHDEGGTRGVDVSLEGRGYDANHKRYVAEERGEDLRLAYVALTRARHRAVVHWAGTWDAVNSPLNRLLFARDQDGEIATWGGDQRSSRTQSDADTVKALEAVAERSSDPDAVAVEWARPDLISPARWAPPLNKPAELQTAQFTRTLDLRWRRTSYSALTVAAHEARIGSEPEQPQLDDEPDTPETVAGADLPLAGMAAGPAVGTVVHNALDAADFNAP
ncbi:MAG: UvrD-helicase domain-containing protein, partial [Solirubrobacterales bacterium]|nr:UvrD-helicase domain-containing protein [Solirubrobacterales bacterium]